MTLNIDNEIFMIYVVALNIKSTNMVVYPSQAAQIELLKPHNTPTTISIKYSNYTNIFSSEFATELPKHTNIINHIIGLEESKRPPYNRIYSLKLMELEMLKP